MFLNEAKDRFDENEIITPSEDGVSGCRDVPRGFYCVGFLAISFLALSGYFYYIGVQVEHLLAPGFLRINRGLISTFGYLRT